MGRDRLRRGSMGGRRAGASCRNAGDILRICAANVTGGAGCCAAARSERDDYSALLAQSSPASGASRLAAISVQYAAVRHVFVDHPELLWAVSEKPERR